MRLSRLILLAGAMANVVAGLVAALATQIVAFPLLGLQVSLGPHSRFYRPQPPDEPLCEGVRIRRGLRSHRRESAFAWGREGSDVSSIPQGRTSGWR